MPEISVVMPLYNGEKYLPDAIESILNQTFGDFEFIIVCEHGTNEASMEIVERYAAKDKRIRPICNSQRLGIAASLNVGLDAARGKYIARMDGDDLSGPQRFAVQKAFLDAYPDIGICGTSHTVINAPGWLVDYVTDPDLVASQLLFFVPMRHPTIMFRQRFVKQCRYDENLPGAEDYDLYSQFSAVTKMSNVLDPSLFQYRRTGENLSEVNAERDTLIRRGVQRDIFQTRLGLAFDDPQMDVLNLLGSTAYQGSTEEDAFISVMQKLDGLLETIEQRNEELGEVFRRDCLTQTLQHRWYRERYKLEQMMGKKLSEAMQTVWQESKYYSPWF